VFENVAGKSSPLVGGKVETGSLCAAPARIGAGLVQCAAPAQIAQAKTDRSPGKAGNTLVTATRRGAGGYELLDSEDPATLSI
jgi:hypothetical protein